MEDITSKYIGRDQNVPIGMNQYLIINGIDKEPVFSFYDIISCSAIVFKCERGFVGFHYEAEGLLNDRINYSERMKRMINAIVRSVGDIKWVICFTPGVKDQYTNAEKDEYCIAQFFMDEMRLRYMNVYSIEEVTHQIDWKRDTV